MHFNLLFVPITIYIEITTLEAAISCTETSLTNLIPEDDSGNYYAFDDSTGSHAIICPGGSLCTSSAWSSSFNPPIPLSDGNDYSEYITLHPQFDVASSWTKWRLDSNYETLTATIGLLLSFCLPGALDSATLDAGDHFFRIYLDDTLVYTSPHLKTSTDFEDIVIDVAGADTLKIETDTLGDGFCDFATFANPTLGCGSEASCAAVGLEFGALDNKLRHKCQCQDACDPKNSGAFCNPIEFVAERLLVDLGSDALCEGSKECCCSCPNCQTHYTPAPE